MLAKAQIWIQPSTVKKKLHEIINYVAKRCFRRAAFADDFSRSAVYNVDVPVDSTKQGSRSHDFELPAPYIRLLRSREYASASSFGSIIFARWMRGF